MEPTIHNPARERSVVVRLHGDCDLYSAPRFKATMLKRIEEGLHRLLIDMSEMRYLDSTGVGAIICILQAVKRVGGEVRFKGLTGSPRRVLERSNILPLMKVEESIVH